MMKHKFNNILSYFIKDINDPLERAFYKTKKPNNKIEIFYKDKLIYKIYFNTFQYIYDYKNNIIKRDSRYCNYKLYSDKATKYKKLFYNNNNTISKYNTKYIWYVYKQTKYFLKIRITYRIDNQIVIDNQVFYYNGYKYIRRCVLTYNNFSHSQILIENKYELHYYNRFFNLYFG